MRYVNLEDPCLFWIIQASANCRRLVFDATLHRKWCISFYRTSLWNSSRDFISWWLHFSGFPWPVRVTLLWNKNNAVHSLPDGNESSVYLYWECARIASFKKKSMVQQQSTQFRTSEFFKCPLPTGVVLTRFVVLVLHLYISSFIYLICFSVTLQLASLTTPCWETQQLKAVHGLKRSTALTILPTPGLPWGKPYSALRMHTVSYFLLSGVVMTEVCKSSCLSSHSGSITRALSSCMLGNTLAWRSAITKDKIHFRSKFIPPFTIR